MLQAILPETPVGDCMIFLLLLLLLLLSPRIAYIFIQENASSSLIGGRGREGRLPAADMPEERSMAKPQRSIGPEPL